MKANSLALCSCYYVIERCQLGSDECQSPLHLPPAAVCCVVLLFITMETESAALLILPINISPIMAVERTIRFMALMSHHREHTRLGPVSWSWTDCLLKRRSNSTMSLQGIGTGDAGRKWKGHEFMNSKCLGKLSLEYHPLYSRGSAEVKLGVQTAVSQNSTEIYFNLKLKKAAINMLILQWSNFYKTPVQSISGPIKIAITVDTS